MDRRMVKKILLPRQHGSWGFTLEPLLLGLLAAFSVDGFWLALAIIFAFLNHQPIRIAFKSQGQKRFLALFFLSLFALIAGVIFVWFIYKQGLKTSTPVLITMALMVFYLGLDLRGYSRLLFTEILAAVAMGLVTVSMALAAGWNWPMALGLLTIVWIRAITTTYYVRARLRLDRGDRRYVFRAYFVHFIGVLVLVLSVRYAHLPWLALIAYLVLTWRAFAGVSSRRRSLTVKQIGFREFLYGLQMVLLSALGYWIG